MSQLRSHEEQFLWKLMIFFHKECTKQVLTGHPPCNNNPWVIGSLSKLPVKGNGPEEIAMCKLTLAIWPWVKVMIRLSDTLSISNLAVRSYDLDTDFGYVCTVTFTIEIWPWVKVMIRLGDIFSRSNLAVRSYGPDMVLGMCALWPWPRRYDLESRSWHSLGSWTTIVWNIIETQLISEELWPGHGFLVCVHCDLYLGDMTLG